MKKLVLAFLTLSFAYTASAQYDPQALEILNAMSEKYRALSSFQADLTNSLTNEVDKIDEEFKGKITVKGDKFRLELDDQTIINNGTTVWTYLAMANEVNIDNFDPSSDDINPSKIYEIYKSGYKYLYLEEQSINGVLCQVIDLVPENKDALYFKIRMNIVKQDKRIHSWTLFDKSGNQYTYTIDKFTPNVNAPDDLFTFDTSKHPGVEVIDLR